MSKRGLVQSDRQLAPIEVTLGNVISSCGPSGHSLSTTRRISSEMIAMLAISTR